MDNRPQGNPNVQRRLRCLALGSSIYCPQTVFIFVLKINFFFAIHFPCTASSRVFKLKSQFPTSYWKVKVKVLSFSGLSSLGTL